MALLDITDLAKTYPGPTGPVHALAGVSLSLEPGELVAVQGPSGCGKSTLLLAAGGLLRPDRGGIRLDGRDPYAMSPEARSRFRGAMIGFVFQQFHLVPYLDVLDNILAPSLAVGARAGLRARAVELARQFGLEARRHHVPAALSTGERQRTALARALLHRPRLLLADEPTGNLDAASGRVVLDSLAAFAKGGGAVLLVTHDEGAGAIAQRLVRLRDGRVVS